jgi:uncharacterized phage-associated protein
MSKSAFKPDDSKLKELILYLVQRSEGDEKLGAVKLNKLLFYCDFQAYLELGKPITGQEYLALEQGPAPRRMPALRRELEAEGRLLVVSRLYHGREQHKHIALSSPDLESFSPQEFSVIERILESMRDYSGTQISELSHHFIGWLSVGRNEAIPYSTALLARNESTPRSRRIAEELESVAAKYLS